MKPIAKKRFVWKFRKPFSLWFSFACTPILLHEWLHLPTNRHHQDILRQSRHTSDPLSLFSFWTAVCFLLSLCIHKICSSNKETLSCNYTKNHQNTKPGLRFTGVPLLFGWSPEVKNANFPTVQLSKSWGHKLQSKVLILLAFCKLWLYFHFLLALIFLGCSRILFVYGLASPNSELGLSCSCFSCPPGLLCHATAVSPSAVIVVAVALVMEVPAVEVGAEVVVVAIEVHNSSSSSSSSLRSSFLVGRCCCPTSCGSSRTGRNTGTRDIQKKDQQTPDTKAQKALQGGFLKSMPRWWS